MYMFQTGDPIPEAENEEAAGQAIEALTIDVRPVEYLPEILRPAWELMQNYPLVLGLLIVLFGFLLGKALQ